MKVITYAGLLSIGFLLVIGGCKKYENPLEVEQYKKTVYLVGANQSNNEGLQIVNLPYKAAANDTASTYISVATGGSQLIDRSLTVGVKEAGSEAVQRYNNLYLYKATDIRYQLLNSSFYSIPDLSVPLKSGEVYGRMPVHIKTAGLHADSLYALTFGIASVSDPGYASVRKTDSVLLFSFRFYNAYSGTYQETGRYHKVPATPSDTVSLSLTRTLKAISYNTFRFYHLATAEIIANVAANGVTVKVNSDNSLTVTPWGSLALTNGSGTYNPATNQFSISYNYVENGITYLFRGTFTKSSI